MMAIILLLNNVQKEKGNYFYISNIVNNYKLSDSILKNTLKKYSYNNEVYKIKLNVAITIIEDIVNNVNNSILHNFKLDNLNYSFDFTKVNNLLINDNSSVSSNDEIIFINDNPCMYFMKEFTEPSTNNIHTSILYKAYYDWFILNFPNKHIISNRGFINNIKKNYIINDKVRMPNVPYSTTGIKNIQIKKINKKKIMTIPKEDSLTTEILNDNLDLEINDQCMFFMKEFTESSDKNIHTSKLYEAYYNWFKIEFPNKKIISNRGFINILKKNYLIYNKVKMPNVPYSTTGIKNIQLKNYIDNNLIISSI
jgi:hypothetical protein